MALARDPVERIRLMQIGQNNDGVQDWWIPTSPGARALKPKDADRSPPLENRQRSNLYVPIDFPRISRETPL